MALVKCCLWMKEQRSLWLRKLQRHEHGSWWLLLSCLVPDKMSDLFPLAVCSWHTGLKFLKLQHPITSSHLKHLPSVLLPHTHSTTSGVAPWYPREATSSEQPETFVRFSGSQSLNSQWTLHQGVSEHPQGEGVDRKASWIFCFHLKRKIFPNCRVNKKKCNSKTSRRRKRG